MIETVIIAVRRAHKENVLKTFTFLLIKEKNPRG
jgi:hypothetical protein